MVYDFDILVIGGGPAGLSAALRARWLRTYKALPASVAVIDPAGPGGLADWKEVLLTGPSFKLDLADILKDFNTYPVPVIREPVIHGVLNREFKEIHTASAVYTCRAVIVCTGLKKLCNEKVFIGKGLLMTLKDHRYMAEQFQQLCAGNRGKRLLIWGTTPVLKTVEFFNSINQGRMEVSVIIEPSLSDSEYHPVNEAGAGHVYHARITGINSTRSKGNHMSPVQGEASHIESVDLTDERGQAFSLDTDYLLLDFESYMLCTYTADMFPEIAKEQGFIRVDHRLETNIGNVFAAGDITGAPFCAAKAIGEGVKAGFNAYIQVYQDKFFTIPSLYAFYPDSRANGSLAENGFNIPRLQDHYCPKRLIPEKEWVRRTGMSQDLQEILSFMDGKMTIKQIKAMGTPGISMKAIEDLIIEGINMKMLTIHA